MVLGVQGFKVLRFVGFRGSRFWGVLGLGALRFRASIFGSGDDQGTPDKQAKSKHRQGSRSA